MKNLIVRIAPVSNVPVIFYADSKANGQIKGFLEGQERTLGLDFYQMSSPMDEDQARKVAMEFAKQQNIDPHDISVRQRLPKAPALRRKLDDANLVLVPTSAPERIVGTVQASSAHSNLTELAQAIQNEHNKREGKGQAAEQKATPQQPEGAVVQRAKRKYTRKTKEQSAKSKAAYDRYLKEIEQNASQSPTLMEPAQHNATPAQYDQAVLDLAAALAKILKGNPGVL
jgi:hypothetical protein